MHDIAHLAVMSGQPSRTLASRSIRTGLDGCCRDQLCTAWSSRASSTRAARRSESSRW